MRTRKDSKSPWGIRVFYEDIEFELMMEVLRQNTNCGGFEEGKGIDVDLVLLQSLNVEADYADLQENVLGRVLFNSDGTMEIQISRKLADDAEHEKASWRRLRTTLGHECGHIICHKPLFATDNATLSLFSNNGENLINSPTIICRTDFENSKKYNGEWWEFQANKCMANLLLPRKLFAEHVNKQFGLYKLNSLEEKFDKQTVKEIIYNLADIFDLNPITILYRLKELGFIPKENQAMLSLNQ